MDHRSLHSFQQDVLPWVTRHRHKLLVLCFWGLIIAAYWGYTQQQSLSLWDIIHQSMSLFVQQWYGPLIFLLVFIFQPLVLFPSALMGMAAGSLYGPLWGVVYAILGANGAALVMYGAGRFFGQDVLAQPGQGRLYQYAQQLRHTTFEAVLVMHLIFLPYDAVNYFAGLLRVSARAFVAATVLGSLPGIVTFVLFGASVGYTTDSTVLEAAPVINWVTLVGSLLMLIVSLLLSRYVRRREQRVALSVKPD